MSKKAPVPSGRETAAAVLSDGKREEQRGAAEHELLALMFEQAPGFMILLSEPGHVFQLTNAAYQRLIGQRQVIGKPVREALPELEGQRFFHRANVMSKMGAGSLSHLVRMAMIADSTH